MKGGLSGFVNVVQKISRLWARSYEKSCKFFFEADSTEPMRLFRILVGLVLLAAYSVRTLDNSFYFGQEGMLDLGKMLDSFPMQYRWSFLIYFPSDSALKLFTALFLGSLVTLTLGIFPRTSAFIAYLLHVSFVHRNMAIAYGLDIIATLFLFYLSFTKTVGPSRGKEAWSTMLSSLGLRLTQIQVCIIYAYSGLEKLKGAPWWQGDALWSVLGNAQIVRWNLDWMAQFPLFLALGTYATLLFEIYFPALIWLQKWRLWILAFGFLLHLGIGLALFIPFFAALMVASYASFLTPEEARRLLRPLLKKKGLF